MARTPSSAKNFMALLQRCRHDLSYSLVIPSSAESSLASLLLSRGTCNSKRAGVFFWSFSVSRTILMDSQASNQSRFPGLATAARPGHPADTQVVESMREKTVNDVNLGSFNVTSASQILALNSGPGSQYARSSRAPTPAAALSSGTLWYFSSKTINRARRRLLRLYIFTISSRMLGLFVSS